MCHPVTCPRCGKTGWAGCGQHVEEVMRPIPQARRCTCADQSFTKPYPQKDRK